MENLLYMILRGLAVGIMISAPMGPVGMLCIQRTLDKGRKAGFYTGVGAAISDLFYCLLTGFGLSFIEDFLVKNQSVIQLGGSIVLIAFAIYLFRKRVSERVRRRVNSEVSFKKNLMGGFLFTFSNPLILFLIIGLFARFNFLMPQLRFYHYWAGYISIFAGALGWWYVVTWGIDKVSSRFNAKMMRGLNVTIALVIAIFGCVGMITSILDLTSTKASARNLEKVVYLNSSRGFSTISEAADTLTADGIFFINTSRDSLRAIPLPIAKDGFQDGVDLRFSASFGEMPHPAFERTLVKKESPRFAIAGYFKGYPKFRLVGRLKEHSGIIGEEMAMEWNWEGDNHRVEKFENKGMDLSGGWNRYSLSIEPGWEIILKGGNRKMTPILMAHGDQVDSLEFRLCGKGVLGLNDIEIHSGSSCSAGNSVCKIFVDGMPNDGIVGEWEKLERWRILDGSYDDTLRSGGDYVLRLAKLPGGNIALVYESGAEIGRLNWIPGDVKAILTPKGVADVYNVEWLDPFKDELTPGGEAQLIGDDLISITFPTQGTSIRLHRMDQ